MKFRAVHRAVQTEESTVEMDMVEPQVGAKRRRVLQSQVPRGEKEIVEAAANGKEHQAVQTEESTVEKDMVEPHVEQD